MMMPPTIIDFTPSNFEIRMYRGDDFSLGFFHANTSGDKQPLDDVEFRMVVCRKTDGAVVLTFYGDGAMGETNIDYDAREVEFFVPKANTLLVLPGAHFFDIQSNFGGFWRTYVAGEFVVINRAKP